MNEKIFINNAGLVITQSFLPTFFERLGLLQEKAFRSKEDQQKAVCYLQISSHRKNGKYANRLVP